MHITTYLLILDAQPVLSVWSLDLDNNLITLNFSAQLNPANNGMIIDCTAILIGPSVGNISMAIQLLPSVVGLQVDDTTATCHLGMEFRSILNSNPALGTDPDNTFLYYDPSRAAGGALLVDSANETFSETDGFQATQVLPDSSPPVLIYLYLDLNGFLIFIFNQPVNISTWNFTDFSFQVSGYNNTTAPIIVPLTGGAITDCDGIVLVTTRHCVLQFLTLSDLNALKLSVFQQTLLIDFTFNHTSTLVNDFGGNSIVLLHNNILLSIVYDHTAPEVISCDLDLLSNQLTLEITEVIDVSSFLFSGITIQNSPNTSISGVMYTLTGGTLSTASASSSTIVISLLPSDAENIINLREITELSAYLSLSFTSFVDLGGNYVNPIHGLLCASTAAG